MEAVRHGSPYPAGRHDRHSSRCQDACLASVRTSFGRVFRFVCRWTQCALAIPIKLPSLAKRIPDRKAIEVSDANSVDGGRVRNTEIGETQGVDMAEVRRHPPLPASGAMWLSVPRCFGWRVETRQQREMMTAADSVSVHRMRLRDHPARRTDGCGFDERDTADLLCFASVRCSSL